MTDTESVGADAQATFADLPRLDFATLHRRRQRLLLLFAGIFLGAMAMLNILGITKFLQIGALAVAVGVLPYPLTFLCTDFISEFYGRRTANFVVFVGLLVNLVVLAFIGLGDLLPVAGGKPAPFQVVLELETGTIEAYRADGQMVTIEPRGPQHDPAQETLVPRLGPDGQPLLGRRDGFPILDEAGDGRLLFRQVGLFDRIATTTRMAILASMIAYLFAQFIDVYLFHFWRKVTRGRHLWLRNNGSTLVSQLADTVAVVLITFWGPIVAGDMGSAEVLRYIWGGYTFKLLVALADTVPFYLGVRYIGRYLRIDSVGSASGA